MENTDEKAIRRKRMIYIADIIVVIGSLLVLFVFIGYTQPRAIAPLDEFSTTNSSVLFTFSNGEAILIDDNPEFSSPEKIIVKDELVVNLEPGIYYWKIEGIGESEVRTLNIKSIVSLKLNSVGEEYEVVNAGNVPLDIEVYSNETLVEKKTLEIEEKTIADGDKFVGRENG